MRMLNCSLELSGIIIKFVISQIVLNFNNQNNENVQNIYAHICDYLPLSY